MTVSTDAFIGEAILLSESRLEGTYCVLAEVRLGSFVLFACPHFGAKPLSEWILSSNLPMEKKSVKFEII